MRQLAKPVLPNLPNPLISNPELCERNQSNILKIGKSKSEDPLELMEKMRRFLAG